MAKVLKKDPALLVNRDGGELVEGAEAKRSEVFVRTPYNYDRNLVSDETGLRCLDESRTSQEFRDEVNINTIIRRFGLTGELPVGVPMVLQGDFTTVTDYQSAMNLIVAGRESFDAQPAEVRSRFDNDPHKFLDFVSREENFDEAAKLGLVREESVKRRATEAAARRKAEIDAAVAVELKARQAASPEAAKDQSST